MQVKKGDRIQLTGTVNHVEHNGGGFVRVDGQTGNDFWFEPGTLAKATIIPRPLEVGDRVRMGDRHGELLGISDDRAWVRWIASFSTEFLSSLHRIDGEAT